jgi:hypothetical protein
MTTGRYTEAKILTMLLQAEGGVPVAEVCREGNLPLFNGVHS